MYPIFILSGGLATRLHPITLNLPKSLVPILGKPFLFHQLDYLIGQGFTKIILCVGYLGHLIEEALRNYPSKNVNIIISYDGNHALGTGGAIKKALDNVENFFFVMYGDSYLPINFKYIQEKFEKEKNNLILTVLKNNNSHDKSNLHIKNKKIISYNKKNPTKEYEYIDYGLSLLSKEIKQKSQIFEFSSVVPIEFKC